MGEINRRSVDMGDYIVKSQVGSEEVVFISVCHNH